MIAQNQPHLPKLLFLLLIVIYADYRQHYRVVKLLSNLTDLAIL